MTDQTQKTALVGLHGDRMYAEMYADMVASYGFSIQLVSNLNEMLKASNTSPYDFYLMDANLDKPGDENISSCLQVYNHENVKPRVEAGLAKFLVVSSIPEARENAEKHGIPIADKTGLGSKLKEILGE
jgi:hypothetical protein